MSEVETYALGLIAEECGEAIQLVGKALRFGLDTAEARGSMVTPRSKLHHEAADVLAAVDYAIVRGILNGELVEQYRSEKLRKLLDPTSTDNLGRRLAP